MKEKATTAGAFDIRNVIGLLLGIYGLVLVICSFFLDPGFSPDLEVQKQSSDNLWVGIALLLSAVVFFIWTKLNPIIVDDAEINEEALP